MVFPSFKSSSRFVTIWIFQSPSSQGILYLSFILTSIASFFTSGVVASNVSNSLIGFKPLNPAVPKTRSKEAIFPPNKHVDITLGGLFPVHYRRNNIFGQSCGEIDSERGIHRLEAMLYAIGEVNKDGSLLPNITLGAQAHDTCGQDTIALEESLEFIMDALMSPNPSKCQGTGKPPQNKTNRIVGVIGAASSTISIQVANLLRLFKLPQVSYASTSPDLSNKHKYDYFVRTVPSDTHQARAMVDVISALNWSSVFTVRSYGNYAERGMESFLTLAKEKNICVVSSSRITESPEPEQFDIIIEKFLQEKTTHGVVLFCNDDDVKQLLKATARANAGGKFSWVASDFWGTRRSPVEDHEKEAEGTITITLKTVESLGFRKYLTNLNPVEHSKINPWFKEFWEKQFNCSFHSNSSTCLQNKSLPHDMNIDDKVSFVIDAVLAFANALHQLYSKLCPRMEGICPLMKTSQFGSKLLKILRNVSFEGIGGRIRFDDQGDSPGRYDIFRFLDGDYVKVASWGDQQLHVFDKWYSSSFSESQCGLPCAIGYYRQLKTDKACCWTCEACGENEYVKGEFKCESCPRGETPNFNRTSCRLLDLRYLDEGWTILVVCFASFGIVSTLMIMIVFVKYSNTPLVKASGRELTFTLLLGLLLCYTVGISLVLRPSTVVCFVQRFGVGFCVCICYSALLIKTNRIARIFAKSARSRKPPGFINPGSQLLILAAFVIVEGILAGIGIVNWPPEATRMYPTKTDVLLACNIQNYDLIVALSYNILLIILCTLYAFKTRKTPANFNEARYIGFAMYTTCVIWLAFLPVQYGFNDKDYKAIMLSVNIVLDATTLLICVFGPKVYIVLFRPARNIRSRSLTTWRVDHNGFHVRTGMETHFDDQATVVEYDPTANLSTCEDLIEDLKANVKCRHKSDSESTQQGEIGVDNPVQQISNRNLNHFESSI